MAVLLAAAWAATTPAGAEVRPRPEAGSDPRICYVLYDPAQVVRIEAAPGYQVTVQLAPGEQIDSVAVGDAAAWQVTPNRRGDLLVVKAISGEATSNLSVVTDARTYVFTLAPGESSTVPYLVRFRYPPVGVVGAAAPADAMPGRWRLSGDRTLYPSRIAVVDNHVRLEWPAEAALPAIFAIDRRGREASVNGMVRDGAFVIDGIPRQLVFRIDERQASARFVERGR